MDRRTLLAGIAAASLGGIGAARAAPSARVYAHRGLAIRGADPVAYFRRGAEAAGRPGLALDWAGAIWRFAEEARRAAFAAEPEAFAPQYGGYCAWAVAAKGSLASTRPETWSIVGGRLFLNYDEGVQALWNADRAGFIAEADRRWPEVAARG